MKKKKQNKQKKKTRMHAGRAARPEIIIIVFAD